METINGVTVILGDPGGSDGEVARGLVMLGPHQTNGAYSAMVGSIPPGDAGPSLHSHPNTDETFYVAEGELTFRLPDRNVVAGPGTFIFVPRGVVHTAWNSGPGPVRGILLISPGGAEHVELPAEES